MTSVDAVLIDLDDTLYPQSTWLDGAWDSVAEAAEESGVDGSELLVHLRRIAAEGSDKGHIIDRALVSVRRPDVAIGPLVDAFLAHRPGSLEAFPGVGSSLAELSDSFELALVTDGVPEIQRHKVSVLGIGHLFSSIVVADEMSRADRKPSPKPLIKALDELQVAPDRAVMIGDRPGKDVLAAQRAGVHSIRVHTGEYANGPNQPAADHIVDSFADAARLVLEAQL